ncbi:hypothetical protein HanPI659440_Chr03g0137181 [Helianthus annuus]|nr:hypothetical protein HanPI659440_Chr03g0137181 [Helianthus annuus]
MKATLVTRFVISFSSDLLDINLKEVKQCFGSSNEFIRSLYKKYNAKVLDCEKDLFDESVQETKHLASCEYENDTKWGNEASLLIQPNAPFMKNSKCWCLSSL